MLGKNFKRYTKNARILLKEFETHQLICIMNTTNDGNNLSEDITEIDEDQSNTEEVIMVQGSSSEEVVIEFTEERQASEELMKITSEEMTNVDYEQDFTNEAHDEFDADFSEADSEGVEVVNEKDNSKNIKLVEEFKGQL